jgi:4-hydroxybenzoate polyprenyltransferase
MYLNDYFDVKIDTINRPDKMIVGKTIPRASAMRYYQILTALGLFRFIFAFQEKVLLLVLFFLWFRACCGFIRPPTKDNF